MFVVAHPGIDVRGDGRHRPRDHRRRGAVRRHGPLRPAADPPRVAVRRPPRADAQLPGPGGADPALPRQRGEPVLPAAARAGPGCRWWCWPPRRPSSPARPSSRARSRCPGRRCSSGLLPPVTVRQTSEHDGGQIYLPGVNAVLFVGVLAVTLTFRSSARLATAYGVSVTGALVVDTVLLLLVARVLWHWQSWKVALAAVALRRRRGHLPRGQPVQGRSTVGGCPCSSRSCVFTVMATWRRGRAIVSANRRQQGGLAAGLRRGRPGARGARACPARRCSPTRARTPPRWPCGPTSSTTTCCTST